MKLEDLVPQSSEFFLSLPNRAYTLRPCTLADEAWLQKTYGAKLQAVFTNMQTQELCKIAIHLMNDKDKEEFAIRTVTFLDEAGKRLSMELGGWQMLMTLVTGMMEKKAICEAVLQTVGLNRPILEKLGAEADAEDPEKKSQEASIGAESLTCSVPNMVGALNISSPEL